jgi:hypothetical protein
MSQNNLINTTVLQQFINQVKGADSSNQREIKLDIATAKNLSHTISLAMTRLAGNYEGLLQKTSAEEPEVQIKMDGGSWDKN